MHRMQIVKAVDPKSGNTVDVYHDVLKDKVWWVDGRKLLRVKLTDEYPRSFEILQDFSNNIFAEKIFSEIRQVLPLSTFNKKQGEVLYRLCQLFDRKDTMGVLCRCKCGFVSRFSLQEAGTFVRCHKCQVEFCVPGVSERIALRGRLKEKLEEITRRLLIFKTEEGKQEFLTVESKIKNLGHEYEESEYQEEGFVENRETSICCPRCRSTQLTSNKKGFRLGRAIVGGMLLGLEGLLGGVIGSGDVVITCLSCGHKFGPGQAGR